MRVSVSPTSAAVRATALLVRAVRNHSVFIDETERFGEGKCYCNTTLTNYIKLPPQKTCIFCLFFVLESVLCI